MTIYPLTIVSDRYNGVYSHGKYTAWNLHPYAVPEDIFGNDMDCPEFWNERAKYFAYGLGDTPEEAIENLAYYLKHNHHKDDGYDWEEN